MISTIDSLRRRLAANHDDQGALLELGHALHRIGQGDDLLMACLAERDRWNETSEEVQDLAVREVGRRLSSSFESVKVDWWECRISLSVRKFIYEENNHRLATFKHKATGAEFQLLPGKGEWVYWCEEAQLYLSKAVQGHLDKSRKRWFEELKPFLIARWPAIDPKAGLPETNISHEQASAVCDAAGLRLPTRAEWEYACRAGSTTKFYWGDGFDESHVWHYDNSGACPEGDGCSYCLMEPHQPHRRSPKLHDEQGRWNAFGLVDMIGNVSEWIAQRIEGEFPFAASNYLYQIQNFAGSGEFWHNGSGNGCESTGFRPACSIPKIGE